MKKFLLRGLLAFALIFIFLFSITMFLEYKNKEALQSEINVEIKVEEGKIEIPEIPAKVEANYQFSRVYFFSGLTIGLIIPLLFFCYDGVGIIKRRNFKYKIIEGGAICLLYSLFTEVLIFPKILFSAFYRARLVGLSNATFLEFFKGYFIDSLLDLTIALPVVMVVYILYIKSKRWYYYVATVLIACSLISNYLYPYIDEMKNDLIAMEDGELKEKILVLSKEAGIDNLEVMVIPKSGETNSMNAYMTGINNSRRIVFWDTTLKGLSEDEILSVAAHEMGHYKLNHIPMSILISSLTTMLTLLVLHNIMRKYKGKDYRVIDNIPLIIFALNLIGLLLTPLNSSYSRKIEVEADVFAMELTNDKYTNGALEIKFIKSNLIPVDVDNLYKWLAYDHPTVKERIELSNKYNIK
ncbi:M48 family metalloprotease [Clostridium sp. LP20]|uniref:M48 family metalloprotease n=1 Tax=Clostridium sp. LP20 TaxID=3418665 RepID=UPI003EE6DD04